MFRDEKGVPNEHDRRSFTTISTASARRLAAILPTPYDRVGEALQISGGPYSSSLQVSIYLSSTASSALKISAPSSCLCSIDSMYLVISALPSSILSLALHFHIRKFIVGGRSAARMSLSYDIDGEKQSIVNAVAVVAMISTASTHCNLYKFLTAAHTPHPWDMSGWQQLVASK